MADTQSLSRTLVATSDPVGITGGIPLVREIGNLDDFSLANVGYTLFDKEVHAGVFKLGSRAAFKLEGGLAGPNHAFRMEVEGSYDPDADRLSLQVAQDEFESGMVIGLVARFELSLEVKHKWVRHVGHWYQPRYETYWKDALNKVFAKEFDLLPILAAVVHAVGKHVPGLNKILAFIPVGLFDGLRDLDSGIMENGGSLTLSPHIVGTLDLIQLAEILGGTAVEVAQPELAPVVEVATELEDVEEDVGPTVVAGPVFGVQFPTHVQLTGLTATAEGGTPIVFEDVEYVGDELRGTGSSGAFPDSPARLGAHVTHRNGIDITFGWTTSVTFKKIFTVGRTESVDVLQEFGIDPTGDSTEYTYRVDNAAGATNDHDVEVHFISET